MAGTSEGAKKTVETHRRLYGEDYHKKIGANGGKKSRKPKKKQSE